MPPPNWAAAPLPAAPLLPAQAAPATPAVPTPPPPPGRIRGIRLRDEPEAERHCRQCYCTACQRPPPPQSACPAFAVRGDSGGDGGLVIRGAAAAAALHPSPPRRLRHLHLLPTCCPPSRSRSALAPSNWSHDTACSTTTGLPLLLPPLLPPPLGYHHCHHHAVPCRAVPSISGSRSATPPPSLLPLLYPGTSSPASMALSLLPLPLPL